MNIAIQLDFDGTISEEDISFLLLDTYAGGNWRDILAEYNAGRIPVGEFNRRVFGMVKAGRQTMLDYILNSGRLRIRPGFRELVEYCFRLGYRMMIVSNGLTFYIEAILKDLGVNGIDVHAAENDFSPEGMKVGYIGPDGSELEADFKESYTRLLRKDGYYVVYVGDGSSDIGPAGQSSMVFATGDLLEKCRAKGIECTPFTDFHDVINGLKGLPEV